MKPELKKLIAFGVIISFFTSVYTAFLVTTMKQGFLTGGFLGNWLNLVPRTYLYLLPFVLITGPPVRALVDRIFTKQNKKP